MDETVLGRIRSLFPSDRLYLEPPDASCREKLFAKLAADVRAPVETEQVLYNHKQALACLSRVNPNSTACLSNEQILDVSRDKPLH